MNIIHLLISGGVGGIETLTKDIANNSSQNNIFYFLFDGGETATQIAKNHTIRIANGSHKRYLKNAKDFVKFCKDNNADVIICHNGSPILRFILGYAKSKLKCKALLYLHANANDFRYKSKFKTFFMGFFQKYAFKKCDYAIAISQTVKDSFVNVFNHDPKKIKVVYNGTLLERFYHQKSKNENLELIYVGRLVEVKGAHILIKALSKIKNQNIHLNILGSPEKQEYADYLKKLIRENNLDSNVNLCGSKPNVEDYLSKADLYVHSAIWDEGFGITVIEALASGVPCVAFNKGALSEIITPSYNGFLVDELSISALAKGIENFYELWESDPVKISELSANALESSKQFSIQNTVEQLERLY